jgi:hypothetical protein
MINKGIINELLMSQPVDKNTGNSVLQKLNQENLNLRDCLKTCDQEKESMQSKVLILEQIQN